MQIKIKGMNINYIDEGKGNTVLILHGWGSSLDAFLPYINALKDKMRFVALDFPGCGKSDLPESPLTTDDYAELVLEFIQKLELKSLAILKRVVKNLCGIKKKIKVHSIKN